MKIAERRQHNKDEPTVEPKVPKAIQIHQIGKE
jgi:CRISPR/Cas system-associated endonuclease Cas3-HD